MQKISYKNLYQALPGFLLFCFLICIPGKDLPEVGWLAGVPDYDKLIHIGIFGLLGVLFCWPFYKSSFNIKERTKYFILIAIGISIWGLTTEFIQKFFITGRSFDLLDWAADSIGGFAAFLFSRKKFV